MIDRAHHDRRVYRLWALLNGFVVAASFLCGPLLVVAEQQKSIDVTDYSSGGKDLLVQGVPPGGSVDAPKAEEGDGGDIQSRGLRQPPDLSRLFPPTVPNGAFGCFKDQGDPQGTSGRDLSGFMSTDAAMTNAKCRNTCAVKGYAFAGTQVGDYCFCGNSYGKSGPASCTSRCSGNGGEVCGGVWANSVSLTGREPAIPSPPSNGGQCVIDIQGQVNDSQMIASYRQKEIQRWVVTGPPVPSAPGKLYPMEWSTTGIGSLHEDNRRGERQSPFRSQQNCGQ